MDIKKSQKCTYEYDIHLTEQEATMLAWLAASVAVGDNQVVRNSPEYEFLMRLRNSLPVIGSDPFVGHYIRMVRTPNSKSEPDKGEPTGTKACPQEDG